MLEPLPAPDERAVEPETATEMIDGVVMRVVPAEEPHADEQCNLAAMLRFHVAEGFVASTELLTRTDRGSDFAADACIRRAGLDPATGRRYLEEMAFEVKHTQSEADIAIRARKLAECGVRRVFVIHVKKDGHGGVDAGPVKEWQGNGWRELMPDEEIVDRCLAQPIKVEALLDRTEGLHQVTRVIVAQGNDNPVLAEYTGTLLDAQKKELSEAHERALEARDEAHERALEARDEAHERALEALAREGILELCEVLGIEVTAGQRARLDGMAGDALGALRRAIRAGRSWPG